ncbi:MAG: hypothetical protein M1379_07935 [Firmicutes bacterium]|nr:hypothetical protein [Bacillota bacterium]
MENERNGERTMSRMENTRCACGKIVCQTGEDRVIIKCRHCKRYIVIHTGGIERVEHLSEPAPVEGIALKKTGAATESLELHRH